MKKVFSVYVDQIIVDNIKSKFQNENFSKLVEQGLLSLLNNDDSVQSKNKMIFELERTEKSMNNLLLENKELTKTIESLSNLLKLQTRTLEIQSERMEEILTIQEKTAQENYDSLIETFRNFARINNNFNEKELYYLNYLMLPAYKDISSYEDMPNYSLSDIYSSEQPLIAIGARIKNEMANDKENRRQAKKS